MSALREMVVHMRSFAVARFARLGVIEPMYVVETKSGERVPLAVPGGFRSAEHKAAVVEIMRAFFKQEGVVRFVFVCEAWVAQAKDDGERQRIRQHRGSLADYPGRIEVVSIIAEDVDGEAISGEMEIVRESGAARLGEFKETTMFGRFTGLLQTHKQ